MINETRVKYGYKLVVLAIMLYITEIATVVFGTIHYFKDSFVVAHALFVVFLLNSALIIVNINKVNNDIANYKFYFLALSVITLSIHYVYFTFNSIYNLENNARLFWYFGTIMTGTFLFGLRGFWILIGLVFSTIIILKLNLCLESINTLTFVNSIGLILIFSVFVYLYERKSVLDQDIIIKKYLKEQEISRMEDAADEVLEKANNFNTEEI
jgi:hypothetical protein